MHLLIIAILLMVAFPAFSRFVGGCLSIVFWMVLVVIVLGVFGAISN
jgi:hypothetical protein